jgi:hypothetical protein
VTIGMHRDQNDDTMQSHRQFSCVECEFGTRHLWQWILTEEVSDDAQELVRAVGLGDVVVAAGLVHLGIFHGE